MPSPFLPSLVERAKRTLTGKSRSYVEDAQVYARVIVTLDLIHEVAKLRGDTAALLSGMQRILDVLDGKAPTDAGAARS